jgi:hypothetical protein
MSSLIVVFISGGDPIESGAREGSGAFTQARAIVRMGTTGGTAPGDGCDETRTGQELRVPYTAIYVFLK